MSKAAPTGSPQPPASLVRALEKLLKPVIRLLLHHQFTYPQFIALLKALYVDVAEQEMQIGDKRQSDSRIHLLTGVHRKDVKRLRAESGDDAPVPTAVSAGSQLIAQWMGNADYLNQQGEPLALPLRADFEEKPSFEKLVALVVKQDIRPKVILDELLRLGVARMENESVVLVTGAFTPDEGFDEKAFFFGKNLQDHASAGASNLMGLKPSYFDRSVYYDRLTEESVAQLRSLGEKLGMNALTHMNKTALELQTRDKNKQFADRRMNFGVYQFDDGLHSNPDNEVD